MGGAAHQTRFSRFGLAPGETTYLQVILPRKLAMEGEYLAKRTLMSDVAIFAQVKLEEDFGTLEWSTGADIDPTVLHDWPEHVESILERRKEQFAIPFPK